jgi:hypothetical protein
MATRFSNSALVSEQLTVKTPTTDADWNKAVVERADQIVTMAIQCCTNTNALLGSAPNNVDEKTADAIERYFLFDVRDRKDKNLRNYLNKIQTTLIKAAAGLGCAALKIGDSVSKDKSKSVRGVVGGIRNQLFSSYAPFPEDWVPKT